MKNVSSHLRGRLLFGRSILQLVIKSLCCLTAEPPFGSGGWTAGLESARLPTKSGKMNEEKVFLVNEPSNLAEKFPF